MNIYPATIKKDRRSSVISLKFQCPICHEELQENNSKVACTYCGEVEHAEWLCPNKHFVCEACRLAEPEEITLRVCNNTKSKDPFELANLIMHHPTFREHGKEHHLIVAPVIITALKNAGQITIDTRRNKIAIRRAKEMPYGICGSRGDCGAAVGVGIAISIITRATYLSNSERSLTIEATGRSLIDLAKRGGPRCCKESVYSSIQSALKFLNEKEMIHFSEPVWKCEFKDMEGCKKEDCNYY